MNSLLSLDAGKTASDIISKDISLLNTKDDEKIDFKDFLSTLLSGLNTKDEKMLTSETKTSSSKTIDKKILLDKDGSLDSDKNASLNDILNLVTFLKSNGFSGKFPTDTKQLNKILDNKQALNDFKNIKTLKDIFQVAKKYDIGIKNFKLTKEEMKTIETKIVDTKTKKVEISSEKMLQNIKHQNTKNSITKSDTKNPLKDLIVTSSTKNTKKTSVKSDTKNPLKDLIATSNVKDDTKDDTKDTIKITNKTKTIVLKDVPINKQDISHHKNIETTKNHTDLKQNNEIVKESKIAQSKDLSNKKKKTTQKSEIKTVSQTNNLENLIKDKKPIKQNIKHKVSIIHSDLKNSHKKQNKIPENDGQFLDKFSSSNKNNNIVSQVQNKPIDSKQTTAQFTNDLKQQIENYKPPLMKVKMTLSPKYLGEVDVSMVSRGNTLQITINSNTNTMAIFTQNQAEFKNSLVNMGFTNLNMNFSSNQNSPNGNSNRNQHGSRKNGESFNETADKELENIDTINITIPRYI